MVNFRLFPVDMDKVKVARPDDFVNNWWSVKNSSTNGADISLHLFSRIKNNCDYQNLVAVLVCNYDFNNYQDGDIIAVLPDPNNCTDLIHQILEKEIEENRTL